MIDKYYPWIIILIGLLVGYISTTGTKSQNVRLFDIFFIGPLMIYLGKYGYEKNEELISFWYLVLIFLGSTTITYNLRNYLAIR